MNLAELKKWLLAVTYFQVTNSVFNINEENNNFSVSTPKQCRPEASGEIIDKLNISLELRSENAIEIHVNEVKKRGTRIEMENSGYNSAGCDHFKSQILAKLKK